MSILSGISIIENFRKTVSERKCWFKKCFYSSPCKNEDNFELTLLVS